jgi:hypothetical protein
MVDCVSTVNTNKVRIPREISPEVSLFIDSENITRLEPSVLGECDRSGPFVVEVTLRDAAPLDPKFTRFSDTAVRTVFANDPGLQTGHEKTN